MSLGQLNLTSQSDAARQPVLRDRFSNGNDSEATFALLYETLLGFSAELCSEGGSSDNWLDTNVGGGIAKYDSSGLHAATNMGSGFSELNPDVFGVSYSGSSMGRFIAHSQGDQIGPVQARGPELRSAADPTAQRGGDSVQPAGPNGHLALSSNDAGVLNKSSLSEWMDAHALSRSSHHCAMYCRLGMEAAGLNTQDRPQSGAAADYGPFLLRHGAKTVPQDFYVPQVGDVVVFDKSVRHPYGHIEMYDGHHWVSDFMQHSFSPYSDVTSTPPFTIYRIS